MKFKIIFAVACLLGVSVGVVIALIKDYKDGKEFRELEKEIDEMEKRAKKSRKFTEELDALMNWQGKYNKKHYSEDFETEGPVQ